MRQIDVKEVSERLKMRPERLPRENCTFRLPKDLMRDIRRICKEDGYTVTALLEELLGEYRKHKK